MKFDIASKIISGKQSAWVVHAGRSRANYIDFVDNSLVFLEVPYLSITSDILKSKANIRRSLRRAFALRSFYDGGIGIAPSQRLADYSPDVFEQGVHNALVGSISRLFGKVAVGDLVIVPGKELINDVMRPVIRFGEIISEFDERKKFNGSRSESSNVLVRSVRWLNFVPRKEISLELERRIGKPPAVRELKFDRDDSEILRHAYESYIFDGSSSSFVRAERYSANKFLLLNEVGAFIAFLVAAHAAVEAGSVEKILDYKSFTKEHYDRADIENIEIDFASPGYWRIVGASAYLAAFVALGVSVFSSDISFADLRSGVDVINSVAPSDGSSQELQQSIKLVLEALDVDEAKDLQDVARRAKNEIGLESAAKVVD